MKTYPWRTIVEIIIEKDGPCFIFRAHAQSPFFVYYVSDLLLCNFWIIGARLQIEKKLRLFGIQGRIFQVQTIEN